MNHILISEAQLRILLEEKSEYEQFIRPIKKYNFDEQTLKDIYVLDFDIAVRRYYAHRLGQEGIRVSNTDLRLLQDYSNDDSTTISMKIKHKKMMDKVEQWHEKMFKIDTNLRQSKTNVILDLGSYYWTKLETAEQCSLEGEAMGHCVGNYGDDVVDGNIDIYSLRSREGESHVTVGIEDEVIVEFKGKNNKPPILKYLKLSVPFLNKVKWTQFYDDTFWENVTNDYALDLFKQLPQLFDVQEKITYGISLKKEELNVKGDLDLSNTNITSLPKGLVVRGNIYLIYSNIKSLPNGLKVGGNLDLYRTLIKSLPDNLKVGGNLDLRKTNIKSLPLDLKVGGEIYVNEKQLINIPDNSKHKIIYI